MRDAHLVERATLQARWDVFNLANTPIFGKPNNNLSSGAVGSITSLASDPRVMQFALRLTLIRLSEVAGLGRGFTGKPPGAGLLQPRPVLYYYS